MPRYLIALLILSLAACVVWLDFLSGPFLPFTLIYLLLIFVAIRDTTVTVAYCVAIISAVGRTLSASQAFPDTFTFAITWQLATTAAVYLLFCHLLSSKIQRDTGPQQETPDSRTSHVDRSIDTTTPVARLPRSVQQSAPRKNGITAFLIFGLVVVSAICSEQILARSAREFTLDLSNNKILRAPWNNRHASLDGISKEKIALLTFDDGPSDAEIDLKILKVLRKHAAKSIWFVNCRNFDVALHPDAKENKSTLKQLISDGHVVGNHTYEHKDLVNLSSVSPRLAEKQISDCSSALENQTGHRPIYFRAPWGKTPPHLKSVIAQNQMIEVNWNATSLDTFAYFHERPSAYTAFLFHSPIGSFVDSIYDGDIILFHNVAVTAEALDELLTRLEQRGFRFVLPS